MSYLVNIYVKLILAGKKTIEDVPERLKEEVQKALGDLDA